MPVLYVYCALWFGVGWIDRFVQYKPFHIHKGCCIYLVFLIPMHPWLVEGSWIFFYVVGWHFWCCVWPAFCWVGHMLFGCMVCIQSRSLLPVPWLHASFMDFSQSALFLDPSFQFVILHLLTSVCTQFNHLFFGGPISHLPWGLLLNILLTFLLLPILLTWPIQFNRLILTNESISKSLKSSIISVSYYFLQISFTLIPPNILLNTFLSK